MKTAKQINAPQCGEAWTAYTIGGHDSALLALEKLFASIGIPLKPICKNCNEKIEGKPWTIKGKAGSYCPACAYSLAAKSKRGKAGGKATSRRRRTPKHRT